MRRKQIQYNIKIVFLGVDMLYVIYNEKQINVLNSINR